MTKLQESVLALSHDQPVWDLEATLVNSRKIPYGNNNLNFRLARDQVVLLETATN